MFYQGTKKYPVREVILHCAAVTGNWHKNKTPQQIKDEITKWHLARGFKTFGYHGFFMPDGSFHTGRPFTTIGAHVIGKNSGTLGFLMIESQTIDRISKFSDWFTEQQRLAVRKKIKEIPGIIKVSGHNDYANKLCPGFKVVTEDWL